MVKFFIFVCIFMFVGVCISDIVVNELNPVPTMKDQDDEKVIFKNIIKTRKMYEIQKR